MNARRPGGLPRVCVACGAAGVPGAVGPGRCVCRCAAARPRAVRAASFARRVVSKPGQAPPPPTSTAAGPSGALHTGGDCGAVNSPARPRRSQRAPQPGPAATAQVSCPDLTCRIAETAPNFARNSPATISNIEFRSLELQRFGALLNVHPIELRAKLRCGVSLLWSSLLLRGIALLG